MRSNTRPQPRYPIYLLGAALLLLMALTAPPLWTLTPQPISPEPPKTPVNPAQAGSPTPNKYTPPQRTEKLPPGEASDGALRILPPDGRPGEFCPLKHTDVDAEISGFLARVTVTQEFVNPSPDKVEAIYTFPLPQDAAVDDMTMEVGGRVIKGLIKKREEAQKIYEAARNAGHTAALLDQERPNIFTQSVANIPPGGTVKVRISYVEVLKYEAGVYEFVYPMVVGPRYIPGSPTGQQAGGWSPDTNQVPDASRLTPPVAGVHRGVRGSRAGHDISIEVKLDAGVDIRELKSPLHEVDIQHRSTHAATVRLKNANEIPNRDFVLKYDVAGARITDALLTHASGRDREARGGDASSLRGFFSFILQPPDRVRDEDATARELIFVLDTSGSMHGYPLDTAKKTMKRAIENMRPGDTFNFITFAGDTHVLFPQPVAPTAANIRQAISFMEGHRGGGGTEMMKAIRAALAPSGGGFECPPNADCIAPTRAPQHAVRIVCFMTDGYVGNDMAIIGEIQKYSDARVFSFGIGTSVNRFLLEKMAEAGRGEAEFVLHPDQAEKAADRFYERVHTPVLADIAIDWNGLPVTDVLPARALDLFSAKPLVVTGRYTYPASGTIKLRGRRAGQPFEREIKVTLPAQDSSNQALAQLWARTKIHDLMQQDWNGLQSGNMKPALRDAITQLGLDYRLMTQFTSFVAVEEQTVVEGGRTRTIHVPVDIPQGVNPDTAVGGGSKDYAVQGMMMAPAKGAYYSKNQVHRGMGAGVGGGVSNGAPASSPVAVEVVESRADMVSRREREAKSKAAEKLHPKLQAVYECWVNAGRSAQAQCAGLKDGRVRVEVHLTSEPGDLYRRLAAAGMKPDLVDRSAGMPIAGSIPIDKLEQLMAMAEVKLIALAK